MTRPEGLEGIMLNAIRYRATTDTDLPALARADRRWLLSYIDRLTKAPNEAYLPRHEGQHADCAVCAALNVADMLEERRP